MVSYSARVSVCYEIDGAGLTYGFSNPVVIFSEKGEDLNNLKLGLIHELEEAHYSDYGRKVNVVVSIDDLVKLPEEF